MCVIRLLLPGRTELGRKPSSVDSMRNRGTQNLILCFPYSILSELQPPLEHSPDRSSSDMGLFRVLLFFFYYFYFIADPLLLFQTSRFLISSWLILQSFLQFCHLFASLESVQDLSLDMSYSGLICLFFDQEWLSRSFFRIHIEIIISSSWSGMNYLTVEQISSH
jgi:hypothetical protein